MAVGFKHEGQDFEDIYVKWTELSRYEGILDLSYAVPGGMWMWGENTYGQLGRGNITNTSSPVQVGALMKWVKISIGAQHTAAIKSDGTLWTWGYNSVGQLGINNALSRSSPVQVGALTNWRQVSCGDSHTMAIKSDGSLWGWGWNTTYGQTGTGTVSNRSSPFRVGTATTWMQVASGYRFSAAVTTDGTLWTWGENTYGQLGHSDIVSKSTPVKVGSLTNWSAVSCGRFHFLAIKTDGTLWACGENTDAQLGIGTSGATHRSSPVQVGSLTNWATVACSNNHNLAIKTDGTLWAWGSNLWGQLGVGNVISHSSPVQIGTLAGWKEVQASASQSLALRTNGTMWAWGENTNGRLGLGDVIHRSSPVQVGSLNTWQRLYVGTVGGFGAATQY